MRSAFLLVAPTAVLVLPANGASAATGKPWLWQCTQIHNLEAQYRCYVRLLREDREAWFRERGCTKLSPVARSACATGALKMNDALVTLS